MHILEIPSYFPPFGGAFCLDQARALQRCGNEVRILSNMHLSVLQHTHHYLTAPIVPRWETMSGVEVYRSYQRDLPKSVRRNINRGTSIIRSMFNDYVRRYGRPDILHAHCTGWAGWAAMHISHDFNIPYVITEHTSKMALEQQLAVGQWQADWLRQAMENAAMVIPVAEELVADFAAYVGTDYRWTYVSNVIDVDFFHYQEREPLADRPFRFCCIANNEWRKGYDVLLDAFNRLPGGAELHLAGPGTERLQTGQFTFVHGSIDRESVRQLLYRSDALVLASRSEVQPLVLMEAMSTGIPVVSTTATPRCQRVLSGCHIVPVDDAAALSAAMADLMHRRASADGRRLSEEVRQMTSPEVVGQQLASLFQSLVDDRHAL